MRLYHFTKAEHAISSVGSRRIKIAELKDLNDPFDLRAPRLGNAAQRGIWNEWRDTLGAGYGMICFCRDWQNPVMWSHYADRHRGVCLGFDIDDDLVTEVTYQKSRIRIDLGRPFGEPLMKRILFTKALPWAYEKEVRVWTRLTRCDERGLYFEDFGPHIRLREIIVGPLCSLTRDEIKLAIEAGRYRPAPSVKKARLAFKSFGVVKQRLGLK